MKNKGPIVREQRTNCLTQEDSITNTIRAVSCHICRNYTTNTTSDEEFPTNRTITAVTWCTKFDFGWTSTPQICPRSWYPNPNWI